MWLFIVLGVSGACERNRLSYLEEVDKALKNADAAQLESMKKADSLAFLASTTPDAKQKIKLYLETAGRYRTLDLEKSLYFLLEAYKESKKQKEFPTDSLLTLLQLASLFNSEGLMVKEASDIFQRLDPSKLPDDLRENYFILGVQINKTLADRAIAGELKELYAGKASAFRDSVVKISPGSTIIAANKFLEKGEIDSALWLMKSNPPSSDSKERIGPYYHYLANLFKLKEQPDSQIICLAIASADDLKHGVREYMALTELADILKTTDSSRARAYIERSYQDAKNSHSSLRQREIGPIYTLINNIYAQRQKRWILSAWIITVSLIIILLSIIGSVIMLRRKNRQLSEKSNELQLSHALLDKANAELETTNHHLEEESRVKSYYIHSFMELCLSYLGKMESYRAKLGKLAAGGDIKKVVQAINSSRYVNQEISEFYDSFDKTFFSLYPDFINELNSLLQPGKRYPEERHLSTELRIYALLWLGIEASGEIAKFLRCSESTVYNYRTIMRNKAIDRSNFERKFIEISKAKRHQ